MKQTNLKRAVKNTASVLAALLLMGLLTGLLTGCPQDLKPQKITITVKGDANVTVNEPKALELVKGVKWSDIKAKVNVVYKDGYEAKGWKLDSASGEDLKDDYAFNESKTIFVLSKIENITITVKGDANVTVNEPKTLELVKGVKWSDIKAKVNVAYTAGYEAKGWKLDGANGQDLEDSYVFNESKTVFALSKEKPKPQEDKIKITVEGDANVIVNEPKTLEVIKGSKWNDVKAKVKVSYKDGYEEAGWKLGSTSVVYLRDNYVLKENTTVFALSKQKGTSGPETVTITVKGDEGISLAAENTLTVDKNSKWQDLKEAAKNKITLKSNYEFVEWRLNDKDGEVLTDDKTFTGDKIVFALSKKTNTQQPTDPSIFKTDGNGIIIGCTCTPAELPKSLVIPDKIGDEVITGIGKEAFLGWQNLTSISLPASITTIDEDAFCFCHSLTNIDLSSCTKLTTIGNFVFGLCQKLTSINLPASVSSIGDGVFAICQSLTNLSIDPANKNYKSIDNTIYTKDGATLVAVAGGLTSLNIPVTVTSIQEGAFYGCKNLKSLSVDSDNETYKSADNILYTKNGLTLIAAAVEGLTSLNIPNKVTTICEYAFYGFESLTSVDLSGCTNLTKIDGRAFSTCKNAEIKLPESINQIGFRAFGSESYPYDPPCKKILIKKGAAFERIKALVKASDYPEDRVGEYE